MEKAEVLVKLRVVKDRGSVALPWYVQTARGLTLGQFWSHPQAFAHARRLAIETAARASALNIPMRGWELIQIFHPKPARFLRTNANGWDGWISQKWRGVRAGVPAEFWGTYPAALDYFQRLWPADSLWFIGPYPWSSRIPSLYRKD
jgi:hypothetical protein